MDWRLLDVVPWALGVGERILGVAAISACLLGTGRLGTSRSRLDMGSRPLETVLKDING